jgi:hypothetical protein
VLLADGDRKVISAWRETLVEDLTRGRANLEGPRLIPVERHLLELDATVTRRCPIGFSRSRCGISACAVTIGVKDEWTTS